MFVYTFPAFLGVPPQRHLRFSRIEVAVDFIYILFWLASASALANYGNCPKRIFSIIKSELESCLAWNLCLVFGFLNVILFSATFIMGGRDLWKQASAPGMLMKGRGNWREWGSDENLEPIPPSP